MTERKIDTDAIGSAAIVVAVQPDGAYAVHVADSVCTLVAADLLRGIAEQLMTDHGVELCIAAGGTRRQPSIDEPADPRGGSLDRDRRVWRDARGDTFDLSLGWTDQTDSVWSWHGTTGQFGEPVLHCEDGEAQPLSVVRALYGPLSPAPGRVA
jgi:hypothetical protein